MQSSILLPRFLWSCNFHHYFFYSFLVLPFMNALILLEEMMEENKSKKLSTAAVSRANYDIKLRTLAIAEKQDQHQEVIFDLEVEKHCLELELIRIKIDAQNRLCKD